MLLYRKSSSQTYHTSPYGKTEKDFLIVACIIVAETRLLLLGNFETKARNLGMRPKVYWRPMLLSQEVFIPNVPHILLRKNGERLPIVACVKAADNSATFTRKNQDLGLIFSNETQRVCLRPMLLFWKSFEV